MLDPTDRFLSGLSVLLEKSLGAADRILEMTKDDDKKQPTTAGTTRFFSIGWVPVAAIAVLAVLGEVAGPLTVLRATVAAILATGAATSVLCWRHRPLTLWLSLTVAVAVAGSGVLGLQITQVQAAVNGYVRPDLARPVGPLNRPDQTLTMKDLRDQPLRGANLAGSTLRDVWLPDAHLEGIDLREAVLKNAQLPQARMRGAQLAGADLRGADLRLAFLAGADLTGADLRDACLRRAILDGTTLNSIQFEGSDWTDAIIPHDFPRPTGSSTACNRRR